MEQEGELHSSAKDRVGWLGQASRQHGFSQACAMLTTTDAKRAGLNTAVATGSLLRELYSQQHVFIRGS